jgi:predicted DNA-binding WGR domain protein
MSHFTKLKTKIIDKECLLKALKNLNYAIEENSLIRGYNRRTRKGDIVIKANGDFDVGFVKDSTDEPFQVLADWYGAAQSIGSTRKEFINSVQREYATTKVLHELRKKGYRIKSRSINDAGEIKLLVVKRGYVSR